jgi:hypothetical protein
MQMIRALAEEGSAVRRRIEGLQHNPFPDDVLEIEDRPGIYEIFEAGYWISYRVDRSDPGESVIVILLIEEN